MLENINYSYPEDNFKLSNFLSYANKNGRTNVGKFLMVRLYIHQKVFCLFANIFLGEISNVLHLLAVVNY